MLERQVLIMIGGLFSKREGNGVPSKNGIYKTVEKYRGKGKMGVATAVVYVLKDTEMTGIVGLRVNSFDGIPWFAAVRLKDIYELHIENKIQVLNMSADNEKICINSGSMFTFYKRSIPNPSLRSIPKNYSDKVVEYISCL